MPEKDKKRKLTPALRREIRQRAKVESGRKGREATQGTATGRAFRKTFTKSKYGVKKVGAGTKRGVRDVPKPEKPKYKKVDVQAKKFESRKGETGRSKTYSVETKAGMTRASEKAQKEAGFTKKVDIRKDAGEPTYKENIAKRKQYKKEATAARYKKGERTEKQREKRAELSKARTDAIKAAGGKVGKGERTLKRALKKRMKKDVREGTYRRY